MKTIYVKVYSPFNVGLEGEEITFNNVKKYCVRVFLCPNAAVALNAYANTNTGDGWSTLLDDDANIDEFVNKVTKALIEQDIEWLETYCV